MKIGIDVSQMVYRGHGVGRYVEDLSRALLMRQDHDYIFYAGALRQRAYLTMRSKNKPWSRATWRMPLIPPRLARFVWNYTKIPIERVVGKVDIFHTSDWTEPYTYSPAVTTVHDLAFRLYPETVAPLVRRVQTKRLARVITHGTHIIADSQSTKHDLMQLYAIPDTKIDVVYPGISERFEQKKKTEIERVKKKYNLPTQYILTLGTKEPRKNLPRLIEALSGLTIPLVVTGRQGWATQLAAHAQVIETGFIDDPDLPGLYSGATVFAFPSLYEGFGFPVLEAMACGTPVVTSNISSLPEVAGNAGILVDPRDSTSIRSGIDEAFGKQVFLQKRGLAQAKKFSWVVCADKTVKVYEKIYEHCG